MGKYQIYRQGNKWYVTLGWSIVYAGDSKQECLEWVKDNP